MQGRGESWAALQAARAAAAARDADIAATDEALAEHLREAHRVAADCIGRIEAVRSGVESVIGAVNRAPGAAGALETARFLLDANREAARIVAEARSTAAFKAVAVQRLADYYQG